MRRLFKFVVPAMLVAAPLAALAASAPAYNVGTPLSQEEIKRFDFMVGPEGQALPVGHGTPAEGAVVYAKHCEICHGKNGENGITQHLVVGSPGKPYRGDFYGEAKAGISYFPTATLAWDYINRAMPAPKPGSLTHDEVFAVVAFLYYRNGIIGEKDEMNEKTLPKVVMPNHDGFVPAKPVYPAEKKPSWY